MAEYSVAGWEDRNGGWHDTEKHPEEAPSWEELEDSSQVVIRYVDVNNDIHYRTAISYVGFTEGDLEELADTFEERYEVTG